MSGSRSKVKLVSLVTWPSPYAIQVCLPSHNQFLGNNNTTTRHPPAYTISEAEVLPFSRLRKTNSKLLRLQYNLIQLYHIPTALGPTGCP